MQYNSITSIFPDVYSFGHVCVKNVRPARVAGTILVAISVKDYRWTALDSLYPKHHCHLLDSVGLVYLSKARYQPQKWKRVLNCWAFKYLLPAHRYLSNGVSMELTLYSIWNHVGLAFETAQGKAFVPLYFTPSHPQAPFFYVKGELFGYRDKPSIVKLP